MKFVPDQMDVPAITAHGPGWVAVHGQPFRHHLLLTAQGLLQPWHCTGFDQLDTGHFSQLAELPCELVLFGTGDRLRFLHPSVTAPLMARGIGIETMDTAAACRTYNFLAGEGRRVLAALLVDAPAP